MAKKYGQYIFHKTDCEKKKCRRILYLFSRKSSHEIMHFRNGYAGDGARLANMVYTHQDGDMVIDQFDEYLFDNAS